MAAAAPPPAFDPTPAVTFEQIQVLQQRLEALESENRRLQEGRGAPAMPENPVYEMGENFYSADDIYYPAGAQIEDLTGEMTPNEHFIPMNAAAEVKVREYLRQLPHQQRTPTIDNIIKSAMEMRPREGDDPKKFSEIQSRMVEAAFREQHGVGPREAPPASVRPPLPQRSVAPIMSNVRVTGQDGYRGAPRTHLRGAPIVPAQKLTRAMGTVQSNPLGTEQAGVTA